MSICPSEEDRFSSGMLELCNFIGEIVTTNFNKGHDIIDPKFINIAGLFIRGISKTDLITGFIARSYKHLDEIYNKNINFFIKHASSLFGELPEAHLESFGKLFTLTDEKKNPVLEDEDRDAIWDFMHSLVKISIKFIHKEKIPGVETSPDGKKKAVYKSTKYNDIDIIKIATKWNIKLEFRSTV